MSYHGRAEGAASESICPSASDATLDNLTWYVRKAAVESEPGTCVGLWAQIARYVPSVLARLAESERDRDMAVAGLKVLSERHDRLIEFARARGTVEASRVIAYLIGEGDP